MQTFMTFGHFLWHFMTKFQTFNFMTFYDSITEWEACEFQVIGVGGIFAQNNNQGGWKVLFAYNFKDYYHKNHAALKT